MLLTLHQDLLIISSQFVALQSQLDFFFFSFADNVLGILSGAVVLDTIKETMVTVLFRNYLQHSFGDFAYTLPTTPTD